VRTAVPASLLLLLVLGFGGEALGDDPDSALSALTFDRYYDVGAVHAALRACHEAYPNHTRLASMGKSREGRDLWVLTVFAPNAGDPDEKPAFYVDGNTHGNEVQGAEVCLFLAKYLLTKQQDDPWVTDLLRHVTFHVAPTVNPDGRHRFSTRRRRPTPPRCVLPARGRRPRRATPTSPAPTTSTARSSAPSPARPPHRR